MLKGKTPDFGPGTGVAKGIARGMGAGLLAGATSFESVGTQTYADSPFTAKRKFQDALAQERYKTKWTDLTPDQQNILKEDRAEDFSILERAVKEGRFVNPTDTRKFQEQQRSAGGLVKAALPIEQRKLLQGFPLAVSRVVGGYTLNDKRFNAYLGLLKQQLKENLFAEDFARLTPDETDEELKRVVSKAKADAWDDLKDQQGL